MTLDFYSLKEQPFGTIPDTRFLFVSSAHREALGSLQLALHKGSRAVMLVGQPGLGKTTLLFHMFKTLRESLTAIYLFQPPQTPRDLLRAMLFDFGLLEIDEAPQTMLRLVKELLVGQAERQRPVVVIIDQAQHLTPSVLEVLWGLSNPAHDHGMLLQFVLSGPSQIAEDVAPPGSMQLSYQAPTVARLESFDQQDTAQYVDYRLRVAGYDRDFPLFTAEASALIARYSGGVPRKINNLCFTSLSQGYKEKRPKIEVDIVRTAIAHLGLDPAQNLTGSPQTFVPGRPELSAGRAVDATVEAWKAEAAPALAEQVTVKTAYALLIAGEEEVRQAPVRIARPIVPVPAKKRMPVVFPDLIPRIGVAAVVLLTAAATLVNIRRHVLPAGASPVVTTVAHPAATAPPPASKAASPSTRAASALPGQTNGSRGAEANLQGMSLSAALNALSGRSLTDICRENFGQCDSKELQEMHAVNSRLVAP